MALSNRAQLSLVRVLAILLSGVMVGIQIALYLFDVYDDGVADARSLLIGLVLLVLALIFALRPFHAATD